MKKDRLRSWVGDTAVADELAVIREWVVWGIGSAPPTEVQGDARPSNDVAVMFARGHDPEWYDTDAAYRWACVIRGRESDVDELAFEHEGVWGYAPYLADGKRDEMPPRYMRGSLRSDVAPRRKVDQPRPSG